MGVLSKFFGRRESTVVRWKSYRSAAGFYSIEYPESWTVALEDNVLNIFPPDQSGAVTVSAFHGIPPVPQFPEQWLTDTFKDDEPMSERESISRNGWTGFRQNFLSNGSEPRAWMAVVATVTPVFVLITANDIPARFSERSDLYSHVLDSLQLHIPGTFEAADN